MRTMLVLSREQGLSIWIVNGAAEHLVTVARLCVQTVTLQLGDPADVSSERTPARFVQLQRDGFIDLEPDIRVNVVDIRNEKVRLGVVAPRLATVHRLEVYQAIQRENAAARRVDPRRIDPGRGLGPAPVPNPAKPIPPTLSARLVEPRPDEAA